MFDHSSRYYKIKEAKYTGPDGRSIVYKKRRFLPRANRMPYLADVTVLPEDRLDLIAARTLGDPGQFWRICDANAAMNPFDLTAQPGRTLRIPNPQVGGES